jgi:periplasmic protein TonB
MPKESASADNRLAKNATKTSMSSKNGFGRAISSRSAPTRERALLTELVVGEEHAGALTQNEKPTANIIAPSPPQSSGSIATVVTSPMVFQAGMTQPVRIAGIDPSYPQVARLRGVKGTVIMRCVLTEKGLAQNCTILKSPAYLDDAVLSVASTWRFTPVTWQGRGVSVNYVFKVNFKLG